jgi:type I restriction-modification system DNA methylase subunit
MALPATETIHEVDFCAKIASAANAIFPTIRQSCPFEEVRLEGMGSAKSKRDRKDLRFYDINHRLVLTGEVKLPGNINAFNSKLVKDAADKAEEANTQYFFTWDVNTFVLWDRSLWQNPLHERRVKVWSLQLNLTTAQEVARRESLDVIEKKFLPELIRDLADIVSGRQSNWSLPPDEVFLRSLESHLDWPIALLREYLHIQADKDSGFDERLQEWMRSQDRVFLRNQPEEWRKAVDNAARTLAYVWTNRFIFYKALRARFNKLSRLELGPNIKTANESLQRLDELFKRAAEYSGDYETLLFPEEREWANDLVFAPNGAVDAWRGFLRGIESVDFRDVPADVVGLIFQKLISPEERHRFGQHFTGPDAVDLINSFCIRKADAVVLDPACGSGSFLVRAYYRKRALDTKRSHLSILGELFGCDISLYPAHLATLNLAAREINDEANYPRISRRDFFDFSAKKPFCEIPGYASSEKLSITLPLLDAVVGNPPYVRQEKIDKKQKPRLAGLMDAAFKGTKLSGRADLHCYFWPHAAQFLKEGAHFGFLTSAQWLDVDYGFALQRWMLRHFKIIAIMESSTERWFPDARVKTCIAILERCSDEVQRRENLVRFVRFEQPLADIIGVEATGGVGKEAEEGERLRQKAIDQVRDVIEKCATNLHDNRWRILIKRQGDLWDEGVRAGEVLKDTPIDETTNEDDENDSESVGNSQALAANAQRDYVAGKWGRYLRAPDLYFEITQRFRDRFIPLGELTDIKRGITSGCDAFFMPQDVTSTLLAKYQDDKEFHEVTGVSRQEVTNGKLLIVKDGADTYHPIEPEYVAPEVHSLMKIDRPVVQASDLDRVVVLVSGPLSNIEKTHAYNYIKYGEQAIYKSGKSKAVPVPQRSTCAAREPWYDLTKLSKPSFAFWPKGSQYRHIVIHNPSNLIGNCRLNCMIPLKNSEWNPTIFAGILNSTIVALWGQFYGRYTGTEGAMELMVLDVNLIEVPKPLNVSKKSIITKKIQKSFESMCKRSIGDLCEETLKECHSYERALKLAAQPMILPEELQQSDRRDLDDAVFELLGVTDAAERHALIDRLYQETALHFRAIRVTEIQKMEDRAKGGPSKLAVADHAADVWDALDIIDLTPLVEWVKINATGNCEEIEIPSERPVRLAETDLFQQPTVYFGVKRNRQIVCSSLSQAELVIRMAELGVTGATPIPMNEADAKTLLERINRRHEPTAQRLRELAVSRSGNTELQEQVFKLLERWYVVGKPSSEAKRSH